LNEEATLKKARNMVLRLLTYRARSRNEVYEYLERKGFADDIAKLVVQEMEGYGYINDRQFVTDYINYRKMRGFGPKRVRYELHMKGIDEHLLDQKITESFERNEDIERIIELLEKRNSGLKKRDDLGSDRWFQREAAFLQRRGFPDELILTALKKFNISE